MKYVLITGGSQGLGKSLVNVFASNHYNVGIGYLSKRDNALKLCEEINSKYRIYRNNKGIFEDPLHYSSFGGSIIGEYIIDEVSKE